MKKIAVFASGNGSNAENIINYMRATGAEAEVAVIVTNRKDAGVIGRANRLNVPVEVMSRQEINDSSRMLYVIDNYGIDAIVLAGFLLMVPGFLIERFPDKILNIHPSLLPKFGGRGMYGHHVHEAVAAAGENMSGSTVHFVSEECDGGRIVFQASVGIEPTDTPADIETKVRHLEQEHFPRVVVETLVKATEKV